MLKVLCIVDKEGTALDRLAKGVIPYHDNINYKVLSVHPKRPDPEQLMDFEREAFDADIIDWQYYRTAELLRNKYPFLKEKKQILTHNNPYSIEEQNWNDYDFNIGNNDYIFNRLTEITQTPLEYIPLCVNTEFWQFNQNWEANKNVIMVANRIEGKKGILPIAIACNELNLHFILVGSISDMNYFQSILASGVIEFHEQITDEELKNLYYKSTIHICNSIDKFESGTLPILEAMLCGLPVLTRKVGHVPELNNGENMVLLEGQPEDVAGIKEKLLDMISDKKKLQDIRDKAWQTAKIRDFERRAYMYQKVYRKVLFPNERPVSIVVPICDKPEITVQCLNAIADQDYKNIEVLISDDSEKPQFDLIKDFSQYVNFPVKYLRTYRGDYGLSRARNEATIEATGEIMIYCDQRIVMDKDCVSTFVKYIKPKYWLYGNKGGKKEFVENLSCILRQDIIDAGMFNERIIMYGGMSQEIRTRVRNQGFTTEFIENAKGTAVGKSSNRSRKRQEIIKMKNRLWKMDLQ